MRTDALVAHVCTERLLAAWDVIDPNALTALTKRATFDRALARPVRGAQAPVLTTAWG